MDSDEVRKRKEYAERKVKERHAALRKEAEEKRKYTVEHRERVQSQLKREQLLLQKHMQQLNEDEERKAATLARQHEATSRIAAISKSPNKSFAFGSSTPRTLAYLDNLPKSEQQYDKKLRPLEGASPAPSPLSTSPNAHSSKPSYRLSSTPQRAPPAAHRPAPAMTSMTSSMYVTSSAPTTRHPKTLSKPVTVTNRTATSTARNSMMTQSVYTPSRPATTTSTLSSRLSSATKKTPARPITATPSSSVAQSAGRRSMDVRKPPMPRKSLPAEIKKAPIVEESPREAPEVVVSPEGVVADTPEIRDVAPEVTQKIEDFAAAPETASETPNVPEAAPKVDEIVEIPAVIASEEKIVVQESPETFEAPAAPEVREDQEVASETFNSPDETREVDEPVLTPEVPPRHQDEEKIIVPVAAKAPEEVTETVSDVQEAIQQSPEVELSQEILIPPQEATHDISDIVEVAEEPASHENQEESLSSLTHEDTGSSLADELMEIQQSPQVQELHYPMPDEEKHSAANDLVDVFGNDFINGARQPLPPAIQQHVEFDEDTDSGKASPTSSETSSTTDEVTPRGEEVKAVRVMPIVRSAEDIAKKEREAIEQEERKARLAAILAKSRGMASPMTNTLPPTAETISDSPPAATTTATSNSPPTSPVATSGAVAGGVVEESAEKDNGGASDVLARLAAKTNLPSLQKILQRKQGSNPSLQTTESTGGEIY